jgi:Xaa-Pro dipeptidase
MGDFMATRTIIKTRLEKISEAISTSNIDALVLNPGPSLKYCTGLNFHLSERPVVVIFIPDHLPIIVLPELETAKVQNLPYKISAHPYGEDPDTWVEAFRDATANTNGSLNQVGVESRGFRFLELQLLKKALPQSEFIAADDVVASLRMYKEESEVESMQRAVDIAQDALMDTLPYMGVGSTEAEIAAELSMELMRHGSNPHLPFFPIVSGGPNSANPHAAPSDRPLIPGDLLVIDYGANVNGYFSDITRTFAVGDVDPECHRVAEIVQNANQTGRGAVRPGIQASEVDEVTRGVIETAGYGDFFTHRTGHGLGLEVHEDPYIRADNNLILEIGMAFTVEPGIYLPGRFGVRVEDNVVVTKDGVRCLTSLPRELIRLPLT